MAQPANGSPDETWTGWTGWTERTTGEAVPAVAVAGARTSAAVARAALHRVGVFMAVPPEMSGDADRNPAVRAPARATPTRTRGRGTRPGDDQPRPGEIRRTCPK